MNAQMNVPKLRFSEFSGEWEEKKLREVADINPSNKTLPESFIYIDLESVENGELRKENTVYKSEAPSRAQRLLKINDVLFQTVRPYQMNNLYFDKVGDYVASTGYAQLRTKQNSMFVFQYLHFQEFVDKVIERCTGTSYPSINSTDLSNISISIPTIPEQTKIATFLTSIDTKIDQLTKKQTLLKQYKKGMMQKLFSQKLRFKADDGSEFSEWEEKNILEIANTSIGLVTTMTTSYATEGMPLIRNSDIKANKILCNNLIYLEPIFANKYKNKMFKENDIVTIHTGEVGISAVIEKKLEGALGFATLNTRIKNKMVLPSFVSWYFNSSSNINFALSMSTGDGRCNYNLKDFNRTVMPIPSLNEQTKIANFLTAIDTKIDLATKQLDTTKQFKKALLQQMFV